MLDNIISHIQRNAEAVASNRQTEALVSVIFFFNFVVKCHHNTLNAYEANFS